MDMNQYLDLFLEESTEHVQNLNKNLLFLEKNPERIDLLEEIFRNVHTLKGMSATMGYDTIAQLTHQLENLLDKFRDKQLFLNKDVVNCLFMCADALENMINSIREGGQPVCDYEGLKQQIMFFQESGSSAAVVQSSFKKSTDSTEIYFNEFEKNIFKVALEKGFSVLQIIVKIDTNCLMKGVRAFMVFNCLEKLGEIIKTEPSVQEIEDEKFKDSFTIVIVSAQHQTDIKAQIMGISEIADVQIIEIESIAAEKKIPSNNNIVLTDKKQRLHHTVRVDIMRLDKLMSLVGELVINKTRLEQICSSKNLGVLNETIEQINRITTDLQMEVQNVRMVSIEQVFNRFPRMVRDLALELGKEVNLILEGKETELDRTVIDEIGDPLVHLIRNAIDHGLESPEERKALNKNAVGNLKLSAKHDGNKVIITVEDDGLGINAASIRKRVLQNNLLNSSQLDELDDQSVLNLIFEPGFSTADKVTDISGRGVGLDVVKSKIQALNGQVTVETKEGLGTKFIIKLPLTLAIIQSLLVRVQDEIYAIPLGNIDETTSLSAEKIKSVQDQKVMVLRGKVLPIVFLQELLEVPENSTKNEDLYVVVVRVGEQNIGLVVDELTGQQEIVINTLGKYLSGIPGIAGATILGDGNVALILDIGTLI